MGRRTTMGRLRTACAIACLAAAPVRAEPAVPDEWHYRIVPGDTLIGLGRQYLDGPQRWREVQALNRIPDPYRLVPGSMVRLPLRWVRHQAILAEAVFVRGDASVQPHGDAVARPLAAGTVLRTGDLLRTGADASATVRFADGSRLMVVPGTTLKVGRLLSIGRPAVPDISVQLIEGTSELRVPPTSAPTRRFEVRTPAVNLGVRGTEFRAGVDPAGERSRLEVLEGRVAADRDRTSVSVPAGRGLVATPGGVLAAPRPLPPAPDLSSLPPRLERLPLRLSWPAIPGAVGYRAQVFAPNAPDHLLLDATPTSPEARWADLPDGRYVLRVRGRDADGLEGRDGDRPFELKARPDAPFTLAPAPDAKAYGDTVTLSWAQVDSAERYHVQVAADTTFAQPLFDRDDVSTPQVAVPLPPGQYHWRVASIAAGRDHGPFGDPVRFEQRALPASPALEAPQVSPEGLRVRWGQLQPGQTAHFQVAEDPAFSRLVDERRTTEQPAAVATPTPGTYYLRARTIDADGFEGPFGVAQRVEVPRSNWWLLMPAVMMIFFL